MGKGFLSFVLGATFLLALLSLAGTLSDSRADYSYENYHAAFVSEIAIKSSFYSAISQSARNAFAAAVASETEPRTLIRAAIFEQAKYFESQLQPQGYMAVFWCGTPSEDERQQSSLEMRQQGRAIAPEGTLPLPECADSFDVDLLMKKIHISNIGFSYYSQSTGIGKAAVFPSSYEVDFS
jgi:hypothetical protein